MKRMRLLFELLTNEILWRQIPNLIVNIFIQNQKIWHLILLYNEWAAIKKLNEIGVLTIQLIV